MDMLTHPPYCCSNKTTEECRDNSSHQTESRISTESCQCQLANETVGIIMSNAGVVNVVVLAFPRQNAVHRQILRSS